MIFTKVKDLKERMQRAGFTGVGLAQAAGISQAYVCQILSGKRVVLAPTARKITNALECEFDDIFIIKEEVG